jgi:hypothetical protein
MASWASEGVGAVSDVNELSKTGSNSNSLLRSLRVPSWGCLYRLAST